MHIIIASYLSLALISSALAQEMPVATSTNDNQTVNRDDHDGMLLEICAGLAVVAVGAVAVYIIVKHSQCKKGLRCSLCGRMLPKGAKVCPKCFTPVPVPPTNAPSSGGGSLVSVQSNYPDPITDPSLWPDFETFIQTSEDGVHWTNTLSIPNSRWNNAELEYYWFPDRASFNAQMREWNLSINRSVISTNSMPVRHSAYFRMVEHDLP